MINQAFQCVQDLSRKYKIDESHSLKHSIEVMRFAEDILNEEGLTHPELNSQRNIIISAAILHDMCDHKYVKNEDLAIDEIKGYMVDYLSAEELDIMVKIIKNMSYSKVKIHGYPDLGIYQRAYHIVREADLLAAYDIDRCVIFGMEVEKNTYTEALLRAKKLYADRVMKYRDDNLFITPYSQRKSLELYYANIRYIFASK